MMATYKRGLFTLSADPIHWGHLNIIQRAAAECEQLVVAVMANPGKPDHLLQPEDQLKTTIRACRDWCPANVTVIEAAGLLVDLALTQDCDVVYRGVRDSLDEEYERSQFSFYNLAYPGFSNRVRLLTADPMLRHIQSTVVRAFLSNYLPIDPLVPLSVAARLSRKVHRQKFVGLAGFTPQEVAGLLQLIEAQNYPVDAVDLEALMVDLEHAKDLGTKRFAKLLKDTQAAEQPQSYHQVPGILAVEYAAHLNRRFREWLQTPKPKQGLILVSGAEVLSTLDKLGWTHNNLVLATDRLPKSDELREHALQECREQKYGLVIGHDASGPDHLVKLADCLISAIKASAI